MRLTFPLVSEEAANKNRGSHTLTKRERGRSL